MRAEHEKEYRQRATVLWESMATSDEEVNRKEVELIISFRSDHPSIRYDRWPRLKR